MKAIYKHCLFALCLSVFHLSQAQESQIGGFFDGWDNYDNSMGEGLGPRAIDWNTDGLREIVHAPAEGVHPRIFFGPSELAGIQNKLQNTASGQAIFGQIHAFTTLLNLGVSAYSQQAEYALDEHYNRWVGNAGHWNANTEYEKLINGDATVWDGLDIKRKHITACMMSLEAFECLVMTGHSDPDTEENYADRAADLATAMAFWATMAINDPEVNSESNNFNNFGGMHMAIAYDLHFNSMTTEQQDLVRAALVKTIPDAPRHGGDMQAYANASNWSTLNGFEIIPNLAIEGEPGYKAELTEKWMRMQHNFITYGWYPSGAGLEGLGKNYQYVTTLIACAKRGYSLLAHPHVRAYGQQFLPAIMQPYGHGFTSYDVWGGSGYNPVLGEYKFKSLDIIGLKYIMPDDPKIDFVWRNYIEKGYNLQGEGYLYQQQVPDDSYFNYLIPAAVFAEDYATGDWDTQAAEVVEEDYFADDRGLAVLKSDTDSDALSVQFHARQDMGGHTHGDRNDFTLSALGRIWVRKSYGGSPFQPTLFHSCVLVDDLGIGIGDPDGDKARQPAKFLEFTPGEEMTRAAADATYAYTWEWHWSPQPEEVDHPWLGENGWEKVTETWNDFQYTPKTEAHYDLPFYDWAHWHQADKKERMVKRLYNPMEKVIRSVAMFKGDNPFVLVVDDVKKDAEVHNYKWLAQMARDLTISETVVNTNNENYRNDVILTEPAETGNRRLLVRFLEIENQANAEAPAYMDSLEYVNYFTQETYNPNPNWERPRLVAESNSVEPKFKVLLFPFVEGDDLPVTNWNITKDTLEVAFGEESTLIEFMLDTDGRTKFDIAEEVVIIIDSVEDLEDSMVKTYPNPASDYFNLELTAENIGAQVEVFDANGRLLFSKKSTGLITRVDMKEWISGVYFYSILNKGIEISAGEIVKD